MKTVDILRKLHVTEWFGEEDSWTISYDGINTDHDVVVSEAFAKELIQLKYTIWIGRYE